MRYVRRHRPFDVYGRFSFECAVDCNRGGMGGVEWDGVSLVHTLGLKSLQGGVWLVGRRMCMY